MDEDKVGLEVENGEEKKKEDENDLEALDEDVAETNDDEEEDRPNNAKEVMPKYLSFVKGVVDRVFEDGNDKDDEDDDEDDNEDNKMDVLPPPIN